MRHAGENPSNGSCRARCVTSSGAHSASVRRASWRLFSIALALLACACAASAQVNIYQLRGSSDYGIYTYNTTTNTVTQVYDNYPRNPNVASTNSATLAQRPSDGMLFYVMFITGNSPIMFSFNPATPNIAPVQVGNGLGVGVPSSLRMAFSPTNGLLYYLPDSRALYTINTTTGVATPTGVTVGTSITSGGDMAFSSTGQLYVITSTKTLYTVSTTTGTATRVGNAAINFTDSDAANQPDATLGLAFDSTGRLLTQTRSPNRLYSIALPVANNRTPQATFVSAGDGDTSSTGDMASANVPAPNLSITKTDNATTIYRGNTVTYTIVVTNNSAYDVTGTVTDNAPATLSGVTWTCTAASGSSCGAASGSGNNINTTATLEAGDTATYTVTGTLSATATGTLSNTASVLPPTWLVDSNLTNNNATDTTTIASAPDVRLQKRCTSPANCESVAQQPGAELTYTITFTNTAGASAAQGLTIVDIVPFSVNIPNSAIIKSTEFKVGSMTFNPGTTGLTITPAGYNYYNDAINYPAPAPPWNPTSAYTPTGTFDANVTYVGWQLTGSMPSGTSGSVSFTVRIR
jgi:uncharacterized repeat protein (TIGR01451 family)